MALAATTPDPGAAADDICAFRERWERFGKTGLPTSERGFFPGYRGADLMVQVHAWAAASDALVDAALRTLTQFAAAPKSQIVALVRHH